MATATATPNGNVPNFKIVSRLDGVPAIHDSVAYAQAIVNSTGVTASLYQTALALANKSYEVATPVLVRTKPLLESADGLAVATFDRAEATFPYPFKTPTQDLVVVKQAKAVYDARLAPFLQSAQPVISDVLQKTAEINSALGARAAATIHSSQEISHALLEQLRALAEQGKELPGTLLDGVTKATTDIKGIVLSKDATLQEKSNKLGAYVVDQVKPVVDEIYNYVLGAKKKAQDEASKAREQVNGGQ
ncbi:hypothetical protein JCM24511_04485 [Saitozyma sp. JCM 24511]|jgi:hypothetical protein|uniref:Lipid droplet-associated perilipin protein n=1 Tax=Saitozyma podzolica TaxID=1890683 RepID=A0A427YJH7_9TREE|nr:hypothetical protein EHS25_009543 [Saitozyma podzolica]GFZ46238.1 hypothetical protein JCM24511_04485 [Saitozyma sp. JCM 24511]